MMARNRRRIDQAIRHATPAYHASGSSCDARSPGTVRGRSCGRSDASGQQERKLVVRQLDLDDVPAWIAAWELAAETRGMPRTNSDYWPAGEAWIAMKRAQDRKPPGNRVDLATLGWSMALIP